jgi:hypothetical protein
MAAEGIPAAVQLEIADLQFPSLEQKRKMAYPHMVSHIYG